MPRAVMSFAQQLRAETAFVDAREAYGLDTVFDETVGATGGQVIVAELPGPAQAALEIAGAGAAGEAISGHRAVRFDAAGAVWLADKDSAALAPLTAGISEGAAILGAQVAVRMLGTLVEPSWSWSAGPVWLGDDGQLTQTPPTTGALVQVGVPVSSTVLRIDPQLIAIL